MALGDHWKSCFHRHGPHFFKKTIDVLIHADTLSEIPDHMTPVCVLAWSINSDHVSQLVGSLSGV
jgi:hypothetical protein